MRVSCLLLFLKIALFGLCGDSSTEDSVLCRVTESLRSRVSSGPVSLKASCPGGLSASVSQPSVLFVITVNSSHVGPVCCVSHTLLLIYRMGDRLLPPEGTGSPVWYRVRPRGSQLNRHVKVVCGRMWPVWLQ